MDGLDDARHRLYRLATYLSLVAGPRRLLDGDFPRRAAMLDIVEQSTRRTLTQLSEPFVLGNVSRTYERRR